MSDYMSINRGKSDSEFARMLGLRKLEQNGCEILDEKYEFDACHAFIVATDPDDGCLVFVVCKLAEEFDDGFWVRRDLFERAAFEWLCVHPDAPNCRVRLDTMQVRLMGSKGFIKHVIDALGA